MVSQQAIISRAGFFFNSLAMPLPRLPVPIRPALTGAAPGAFNAHAGKVAAAAMPVNVTAPEYKNFLREK
jgi:hypothetical protein